MLVTEDSNQLPFTRKVGYFPLLYRFTAPVLHCSLFFHARNSQLETFSSLELMGTELSNGTGTGVTGTGR